MELRRYGTATTLYFPLVDFGATSFLTGTTAAAGDIKISKDGGAFENTNTTTFTEEGYGWYSVALTATEMEARQICVSIIDQTNPKEWEDQAVILTTCGHASAEVPYLADASVAAVKAKTDNLPAAPAATGDIPTAVAIADALLKRDVDNVEATAPVHSLASVILKLVSRFVASTGATYRTNGSTVHMTQTPTTDPSADAVTELGVAA